MLKSIILLVKYIEEKLLKVAATSLKLETRLHAHQDDTNTRSGTEVILRSSDWLMTLCSELDWFARSLISGLNDGAATLRYR